MFAKGKPFSMYNFSFFPILITHFSEIKRNKTASTQPHSRIAVLHSTYNSFYVHGTNNTALYKRFQHTYSTLFVVSFEMKIVSPGR